MRNGGKMSERKKEIQAPRHRKVTRNDGKGKKRYIKGNSDRVGR